MSCSRGHPHCLLLQLSSKDSYSGIARIARIAGRAPNLATSRHEPATTNRAMLLVAVNHSQRQRNGSTGQDVARVAQTRRGLRVCRTPISGHRHSAHA